MTCKHLTELLKVEIPAIHEAEAHRYILEIRNDNPKTTYQEAVNHFETKFLATWAEGYKMCYCQNVCKDREICEDAKKIMNQYQDKVEKKQ
jgi:hypothetical protein